MYNYNNLQTHHHEDISRSQNVQKFQPLTPKRSPAAEAHIRLQGLPCHPPPCSILISRRKRLPILAKPMYRPRIFLATWIGFDIHALWGGRLERKVLAVVQASGWVVRSEGAGVLMI